MNYINITIIVVLFISIGSFGYFLIPKENTEETNLPKTTLSEYLVFSSQEECEKQTGQDCTFQICDYIPSDKTYEEVCGDLGTGWIPIK